jgi:hypothetical protein
MDGRRRPCSRPSLLGISLRDKQFWAVPLLAVVRADRPLGDAVSAHSVMPRRYSWTSRGANPFVTSVFPALRVSSRALPSNPSRISDRLT